MSDIVVVNLELAGIGLFWGLVFRFCFNDGTDNRTVLLTLWTVLFGGYCVLAHIWGGLIFMVLLPLLIVLL